jgi:hypothetical protein
MSNTDLETPTVAMICGPDEEGAHAPDTELGIAPTSTADVEPDVYDDELPTLTRKKSASVFEELKVVRSRCPGASQVYPAAALILASFTLVLSIIINRSTYDASACPKGTDFFVLASSRNLSKIGCFSEGLCKTELDKGLPTRMSNGQNASAWLASNTLDCQSDIGGLYYPFFSDVGADPPQYWVFAIGLLLSSVAIVTLVMENYLRQDLSGDSFFAKQREVRQVCHCLEERPVFIFLKTLAAFTGIAGAICLVGLSWCSTKSCPPHGTFALLFFSFMVVFQVSNTIIARWQLKWSELAHANESARNSEKRRKMIVLRKNSLKYKYVVMGVTLIFFIVYRFIGLNLMNMLDTTGKWCGIWWEEKEGSGVYLKDLTLDCCGQVSQACLDRGTLTACSQTITILSLLSYLLTFWNDFRIDPSAEVEAIIAKAGKRMSVKVKRLSMVLRLPNSNP